MADPRHFDVDPDPTFHADADPVPGIRFFLSRERKKLFFQILIYFFLNLTKLVMSNFLRNSDLIY